MKSPQSPALSAFGLRVWKGSFDTPYPPHRHNEIEVNAIESGFFTYVLAGREVTVQEGEVGLFWGAIPHQVIASAVPTHLYWATIPLQYVLLWELPQPFIQALLNGTMFLKPQPLYDLRFFERWEHDLATGHQTLALMEIKSLMFRFAQASQPDALTSEVGGSRANQMALFMSRHFDEPIMVEDIAREVQLHPNYAMSIFRKTFGLSLIEYLTQQRIAHAQQMLIVSDMPIAEIALASGFPTLSHFYTAFKRLCQLSPARYRTSMQR